MYPARDFSVTVKWITKTFCVSKRVRLSLLKAFSKLLAAAAIAAALEFPLFCNLRIRILQDGLSFSDPFEHHRKVLCGIHVFLRHWTQFY
jgi:hypothetical protein